MSKPTNLDERFRVVATVKSVAHSYVGTKVHLETTQFETLIGTFDYVFPKAEKPKAGDEIMIYFDRDPRDPEKKILWVGSSKASTKAPVATVEA